MMIAVQADARALPFRAESVQCVVTSPPYFGLRDYGTARWEGGDPACDHKHRQIRQDGLDSYMVARGAGGTMVRAGGQARHEVVEASYRHVCGKCGATRIDQQIGLEATIDAYVAQLVTVFREVWRVLKPDGVCWLNLGDSYANDTKWGGKTGGKHVADLHDNSSVGRGRRDTGLKSKDLCMIPARVALALQADGWYLRSEIVWSKPNPMPESVTDRPTKAHEMIYLLAKNPAYYFDADAVREKLADVSAQRYKVGFNVFTCGSKTTGALSREGTQETTVQLPADGRRNIRSVWHIATQPYPGAHFATMPEKLVERCILAGSRAGDLIGDPFVGSGTVARVALRLGRRAVVSDLNPQYFPLIDDRTRVTFGLPFVEDDAAINP